jgi:hypothetical protein
MKIGRLEKLELRELWKKKQLTLLLGYHKKKIFQRLSEAVGIELEVQGQEESVGPFSADILCKDTLYTLAFENSLREVSQNLEWEKLE